MKMARILTLFVFALLIAANTYAQKDVQKNIDQLLKQYEEYGQLNAAVLVADKGKVIYEKGFGMANMEWKIPIQPDTKFRIVSELSFRVSRSPLEACASKSDSRASIRESR